jgi:hypothetical protein
VIGTGAASPKTIGYGLLKMSGTNVSFFAFNGEFSRDLENEGSEAMIDFVVNELKSTFGSKFYDKYFIKAMATGWCNNPFTLGSYAYSTVHGADRSGRRAVGQLINLLALKS